MVTIFVLALATLALAVAQPTVSEPALAEFYARVDPAMSQKRVQGKVDVARRRIGKIK